MATRQLVPLVCALAAAAGAGTLADAAGAQSCPALMVPAYIHPADTHAWGALLAGAAPGSIVVVNPDSGPGTRAEAAYVDAVARARAAGLRVLGYVATRWGARKAAAVRAEADRYFAWYGVHGIFFDEAATGGGQLSYYRGLYRHVKSEPGRVVVLNHGAPPDERYLSVADVAVVWEGAESAYASAGFPAWVGRYPKERFGHLVYASPADRLADVLALAAQRNAGRVFVTDDTLPNPWDTVPEYLPLEQPGPGNACPA